MKWENLCFCGVLSRVFVPLVTVKTRPGEHFVDLTKSGEIKHMCDINTLVTLKEYLEDFAKP
jgi:hypothetical protein